MENLNRKNFFDALSKRAPLALNKFQEFIDGYKREINWQKLFNTNFIDRNINFENLPFEMQIGILNKFFKEYAGSMLDETHEGYLQYFYDLEKELNAIKK